MLEDEEGVHTDPEPPQTALAHTPRWCGPQHWWYGQLAARPDSMLLLRKLSNAKMTVHEDLHRSHPWGGTVKVCNAKYKRVVSE